MGDSKANGWKKRRRPMKKKFLALVLTLAMVLSLVPMTALATEGGQEDGETSPAGSTIYVDATNGDDDQDDVGTAADKAYKTLEKAVTAAVSGDTIRLSEGKYTLYKKGAVTKDKDLTFVGQGTDKTSWGIGATMPDPDKFGTEYNGDYSFDGAKTITFKDMTLQSASADYLGFIRADQTVVEDCIINGKTFFWGYKSATFTNTTFNCPSGDYALWTYSSPTMTFNNCTFNSSGKVINVYTDAGAGKNDITVNFKDCTVNNSNSGIFSKQVLNINDSNMGDFKYRLNISGDIMVSNVKCDGVTCSRLFGFGGKATTNNTGRLVVKIEGKTVWENGKRAGSHSQDFATGSYDNGNADGKKNQYTEGYKDNAFTTTKSEWTFNPQDGKMHRTVTKKCNYCGDEEVTQETKEPTPVEPDDPNAPVWQTSKSKRATNLNGNYESEVTLSLPSAQKETTADVVMVMDVSSSMEESDINAFDSIDNEIIYLLDKGSYVEDYMGYVEGDYNFDFINDASKLTVTVGQNESLKAQKIEENCYGFGPIETAQTSEGDTPEIGEYQYMLDYVPGEKKGDEHFVWHINVPVRNSDPVALTYSVKLVNPKSASGTYGQYDADGSKKYSGLYTNNSATLHPKDSNKNWGIPENFLKPTVSYTVSGGGSGGSHKPTVTIPDDVPTGLNGKDHYAYVVGYPDGMVYPQKNITRAEVATIFFRLLEDETREANMTKSNGYNDMKDGAWYTCAVSTLSKMGIIKGYEDGSFKPDASISRAEFAAIAARFDPDGDKTPATFSDVSSHWAKDEISIAANHGWIKGYEDGSFKPDQKITRAETMTLVNRVLKRLPETKDDLHKDMKTWPDNQNESAWFYLAVQEATNSHYQNLKKDGTHEKWESMRETRDWAALEK